MDQTIEDRVSALESTVRTQRRWLAGCVGLLVALPLLAAGPAKSLLRADRVEAREVVVVGEDGAPLLTLSGDDTGGRLELIDHVGDPAVVLGARAGSRRAVHVGDIGMRGWGVIGAVDPEQPLNPAVLRGGDDDDAGDGDDGAPVKVQDPRLRQGFDADEGDRRAALRLVERGWVYVMPKPKSRAARWGNSDSRTTWFSGYWKNTLTDEVSATMPREADDFAGDGVTPEAWSAGGSPAPPGVVEWLCSREGGVEPGTVFE